MRLHPAPIMIAGLCLVADAGEPVSYDRDVRPILKAACTHCHGEEEELAGGVDLRLRRFMDRPGDSGEPIVVAGQPDESLLMSMIVSGEMPEDGKPLDPAQIDLIRAWIAAGAVADAPEPESLSPGAYVSESERRHWAFQPIVDPPVPPAGPADRVRTPIDAFLAARLHETSPAFAPDADRRTLIRRVTLDLTGLLPTP